MRIGILWSVIAVAAAACAGQPATSTTSAVPPASGSSGGSVSISPEVLANARKLGFTPMVKDEQVLYCRQELKTGSHLQRESQCMTPAEFETLRQNTQQQLDDFQRHSRPPTTH